MKFMLSTDPTLGEWTGWLYTDARRTMHCTECGSKPGEPCLQPSGRKRTEPHTCRVNALLATGYKEHIKCTKESR